jgi:hypothetical protein
MITEKGTWSADVNYVVGDSVQYQGSTFHAKQANQNAAPTWEGGDVWKRVTDGPAF